jgi:cardiolipin synthase
MASHRRSRDVPVVEHAHHTIRPTLLLPHEYVADATEAILAAKRHVYFMCLIVADQIETEGFIDALKTAARRGVKVDVAADVFTYGELGGSFIPKFRRSKRNRASNRMARELIEAGVRFTWLGADSWSPFSGRTHSKFCVVDDVVYSFGGVNLYDKGVTNVDYMFRVDDAALAARLASEYKVLRRTKLDRHNHASHAIKYGRNRVLVDGGRVGDSIIYERACALAKKASRVVLVSQYCPTGRLARLIRRVPHEIYFNPPQTASFLNRILIRSSMILTRLKTEYRGDTYLHAKCLIVEYGDGKRAAITGSHNFVWGGVRLGTREIALQTKDREVVEQLERFVDDRVRGVGTSVGGFVSARVRQ